MFGRDLRQFAIVLAVMAVTASPASAQGTVGEAFLSGGVGLRPGGAPVVGGGFAGGWGTLL